MIDGAMIVGVVVLPFKAVMRDRAVYPLSQRQVSGQIVFMGQIKEAICAVLAAGMGTEKL